jgi:hypothetical protein
MLAMRKIRTFPKGLQAETAQRDGPRPENRYAVKVLAEWAKGNLIADGWVQEKPCRVTIDTGASATVARPDVVAGYLGVHRRCKGRVHPRAGYPEGLPRDSGRGMPWATTGQDEVSVREAPTASVLTRSRPAESHRNRWQLCWQCGGTCHLRRESLTGEQLASDRRKARQKRLIIPTGSSGILRAKMMVVRVGRREPNLEATRDEQP